MREKLPINSTAYSAYILAPATIAISVLGYIDYITGEISIDVLYILSLFIASWFGTNFIGALCVIEIMLAKIAADYFNHVEINNHLYEWNSFSYLIMYVITCTLVINLKKALTK